MNRIRDGAVEQLQYVLTILNSFLYDLYKNGSFLFYGSIFAEQKCYFMDFLYGYCTNICEFCWC